jgi:predicted DNA-binding transcriptional regulator
MKYAISKKDLLKLLYIKTGFSSKWLSVSEASRSLGLGFSGRKRVAMGLLRLYRRGLVERKRFGRVWIALIESETS